MKRYSSTRSRKKGLALAVALMLLTVVMILGAALAKAMLLFHQQSGLDEQRQQAFWLAESGYQRAVTALATTDDYHGETWRVSADVLGAESDGLVIIRIETPEGPETDRKILIEAMYPEHSTRRFVFKRELPAGQSRISRDRPESS